MNVHLPTRPTPLANSIKEFLIEKQIGQGAFGQVFKVRLRNNPQIIYAIKKVFPNCSDQATSFESK